MSDGEFAPTYQCLVFPEDAVAKLRGQAEIATHVAAMRSFAAGTGGVVACLVSRFPGFGPEVRIRRIVIVSRPVIARCYRLGDRAIEKMLHEVAE